MNTINFYPSFLLFLSSHQNDKLHVLPNTLRIHNQTMLIKIDKNVLILVKLNYLVDIMSFKTSGGKFYFYIKMLSLEKI